LLPWTELVALDCTCCPGLYFESYLRRNAWEGYAKVEMGLPSRRVQGEKRGFKWGKFGWKLLGQLGEEFGLEM